MLNAAQEHPKWRGPVAIRDGRCRYARMNQVALPKPLGTTNIVTASDLVRHFGLWQERASREPVYVLHRGRPRFVLTSVEIMQALCSPAQGAATGDTTPAMGVESFMDLTRDISLVVDRDLALISASRPARRYFGDTAKAGTPLGDLFRSASAPFLLDAVRRVIASGLTEEMETGGPYAGRSIAVAIDPIGAGACLHISDMTMIDDIAAIRAVHVADIEAQAATGLVAIGRINLRGYLEPPFGPIAAMAGVDAQSLSGTRFVGLIDLATRVAVGQALETAIETRAPTQVDASLLVCGATTRPVRLGFSPVGQGVRLTAVSVAMVAV